MMVDARDFPAMRFSVAMTEPVDCTLARHLDKGLRQEDLTFALWRPSRGRTRYTAVLNQVILPTDDERILQGNVAFTADYLQHVLAMTDGTYGIAFLHSHPGPGWQGMSHDDIVAEQVRLASAVAGHTGLPLVGLTWGNDGSWSARFWLRDATGVYQCQWAETVRVVGHRLRITYHPNLMPAPRRTDAQIATATVWGEQNQADIARTHADIIGLGSVGSIVSEALSRTGFAHISQIDHDLIEMRNLDRTLGAMPTDADARMPKVVVSRRLAEQSHTAEQFCVDAYCGSVLSPDGLARALDCDALFSCVDRPAPRDLLNALSYAHLIPVIDGGIIAKVQDENLIHVDWRMHTISPGRRCMVCLGALRLGDVSLDRAGLLDDPEYIKGLEPEFSSLLARQNVFAFSLSVAAHEVLQLIGLITGNTRIGGVGPQAYHGYPGKMDAVPTTACEDGCCYAALTASAADLSANCTAPNGVPIEGAERPTNELRRVSKWGRILTMLRGRLYIRGNRLSTSREDHKGRR